MIHDGKPLLRGCHSGLVQSGPVRSGRSGSVGLVGPVPVGPVGLVGLVGPVSLVGPVGLVWSGPVWSGSSQEKR